LSSEKKNFPARAFDGPQESSILDPQLRICASRMRFLAIAEPEPGIWMSRATMEQSGFDQTGIQSYRKTPFAFEDFSIPHWTEPVKADTSAQ